MRRKIAAILAADVAEYSRLVAEGEEDALARLMSAQEVFKEYASGHGGRIFNTAGDAILVEFASAVEAARAALEIQRRLLAENAGLPPARQLHFRMGISIGDVVEHGTDLLGDGVNIAARLQTLAPPGGVAISHWVQEQTAGKLPVVFRDIGPQPLKNIPSPVRVFTVGPSALSSEAATAPEAAPRLSPGISSVSSGLVAAGVVLLATAAVSAWLLRSPVPPAVQPTPAETSRPVEVSKPSEPPGAVEPPTPLDASKPAAIVTPPVATPAPVSAAPPRTGEPASVQPTAPPTPPASILVVPQHEPQPKAAPKADPAPAAPPVLQSQPTPKGAPGAAAAPAPTAASPPDRKPALSCRDVLERAQLGDVTAEDRAFLRNNRCR